MSYRGWCGFALVVLCLVMAPGAGRADCGPAPTGQTVRGQDLCLAVRTFGPAAGGGPLVVLLHGDLSDGGPADYIATYGADLAMAVPGATVVAMARPGYGFGDGATSDGSTFGRRDGYREEVVEAIADALARLRQHYRATRLVLIGHSGGAAIGGVIAGKHPGIVDGLVLVACPCDVSYWRSANNRSPWSSSLSPSDFDDEVPATTTVIAITGENDTNAFPSLAADYVESLADRGIPATFVEAAGTSHNLNTAFWTQFVRPAALRLLSP